MTDLRWSFLNFIIRIVMSFRRCSRSVYVQIVISKEFIITIIIIVVVSIIPICVEYNFYFFHWKNSHTPLVVQWCVKFVLTCATPNGTWDQISFYSTDLFRIAVCIDLNLSVRSCDFHVFLHSIYRSQLLRYFDEIENASDHS